MTDSAHPDRLEPPLYMHRSHPPSAVGDNALTRDHSPSDAYIAFAMRCYLTSVVADEPAPTALRFPGAGAQTLWSPVASEGAYGQLPHQNQAHAQGMGLETSWS